MSRTTLTVLWQTFSKYRLHLIALVVLGMLGAILEGIGINAIIPLFSFLNGSAPTDAISKALVAVFGFLGITFKFRNVLFLICALFLFRAVFLVFFGYVRGWITADFLSSESSSMISSTMSASWPYLLQQKLGFVHAALIRDMQRTASLLEVLSQSIQSWSGFLMYFLVAVSISPTITFYTLVAGGVLLLAIRPFLLRTRNAGSQLSSIEKKISQFVSEHIIGMKAVKASGINDAVTKVGYNLFSSMRAIYVRLMLVRSLGTSLFQPFSLIFVMIIFAVTYNTPGFSLISFAATLYLIQKIFTYLESGQSSMHGILELVPYVESSQKFKQSLIEHKENIREGTHPFAFESEIRFNNVSFSYQEKKTVLHDITFLIPKGKKIGIIGPSGSGKTSIADILLRLFEPTSGNITLDGVPIDQISLSQWRQHIGYVAQDVFLLNSSIEDNIRFYRSDISHEQIMTAAKKAQIYDFIETLPEGFKTTVGDRGVLLSGGQRQRIALARALAHNPSLLILDEATSALDSESERHIQEAIEALDGSVTVLMIAHRLSTIENVDILVVIKNGTILELGSPQELRADPQSYLAQLLAL